LRQLISGLLLFSETLGENAMEAGSPWAVLWSGPAIIAASIMIAWGAEAAQFFLAQGIALAMLALLQTLPEFAVEAVLAWHQKSDLLLANLTGALKLLTGFGWPMIYFAAARAYRRDNQSPMRSLKLKEEQSFQVVGVMAALVWQVVIWIKGSLNVIDSVVLISVYVTYIWIMRRLPPQEAESLEDVDAIPRAIVEAKKPVRIAAILGLFVVGGVAVFLVADPFLSSLFGLAASMGVPAFVFIAWVAPMVSEAPEGVSSYYWARDYPRASIALMNLVSSNINQWTLLAALLPVVLSMSIGHVTPIVLDSLQSRELIMTIAQSLLGVLFLLNMEMAWWEATGLFLLWLVQFVWSIGDQGSLLHVWITRIYVLWCAIEIVRLLTGKKKAHVIQHFRSTFGKRSE
jgi:cation:H+ antiporter